MTTTHDAAARTRTITWEDPAKTVQRGIAMGGLEYLRALGARELPMSPIGHLIGMEALEAEKGRVVIHARPAEYHYNPIGLVHGGFAATLLDSATGSAVHTLLEPGVGYSTLEFKVNFVRPLTAGTGMVRAVGRVVHPGSKVATASGELLDERDRLYAHATATCLIMRP